MATEDISDILNTVNMAIAAEDDTTLARVERQYGASNRRDHQAIATHVRGLRQQGRGGGGNQRGSNRREPGPVDSPDEGIAKVLRGGADERQPFVGIAQSFSFATANGIFNSGVIQPRGTVDAYINGVVLQNPATGTYTLDSFQVGTDTSSFVGRGTAGIGIPTTLLDPTIMQGFDDLIVISTDFPVTDFQLNFTGDTVSTMIMTLFMLPSKGIDGGGGKARSLGPARAQSMRSLLSRFMGSSK